MRPLLTVACLFRSHPSELSETSSQSGDCLLEHRRALDSRDCGSAREELHEPKGVRMFTWLLEKQNPPWGWGPTGLQKELEGAGGRGGGGGEQLRRDCSRQEDRLLVYTEGQWRLFLRSGGRNRDLRTLACSCFPALSLAVRFRVPGRQRMLTGSLSLESPPPPRVQE